MFLRPEQSRHLINIFKNIDSSKSVSNEFKKNEDTQIDDSAKSFTDAPECTTADESEEEESQ